MFLVLSEQEMVELEAAAKAFGHQGAELRRVFNVF